MQRNSPESAMLLLVSFAALVLALLVFLIGGLSRELFVLPLLGCILFNMAIGWHFGGRERQAGGHGPSGPGTLTE